MKILTYVITAVSLVGIGCAGPAPLPSEFTEDRLDQVEYRIAPSDMISVRVWRNPELSVQAPVLPDGTLTVPLVGQVRAKDLTAGEMEDLITAELEEFVTAPDVAVVVVAVNSKRASVVGEVKRPGPVNLPADLRVMDALAAAGGFSRSRTSGRSG